MTTPRQHGVVSLHLFQDGSVSQMALYSQEVRLVGGSGLPQPLTASAMVRDSLQRAPSSQQQPEGSCQLQFENQPSVFSPHLEDVSLSWHWVVDATDGEDNRGQGIDHRT